MKPARSDKSTGPSDRPAATIRFDRDWAAGADKLIQGENLRVLRYLLEEKKFAGQIDLVYIDPPFATRKSFTAGRNRVSTVSRSRDDETAYTDHLSGPEYLDFLRRRLVLIRELMSARASLYLHIDYKIGHYVKVLLDEIFGPENFRNDITRIKCNPKNFRRKAYGNVKDLILFYSKGKNPVWNEPRDEFTAEDIERLFKKKDAGGRRYTTVPLHAPGETKRGATGRTWRGRKPPRGRHWRSPPEVLDRLDREGLIEWSKNGVPRRKIYADERPGKKKQDIWTYKDAQYPSYPTEKNLEMLKMIVAASSPAQGLVLDCFCGSGTALEAAALLGRRWIGIDSSAVAVRAARKRLEKKAKFQFLRQIRI